MRNLTVLTLGVAFAVGLSAQLEEPVSGANDYSLVVENSVTYSGGGAHVHGAGLIGGDLTLNGGNASFGQDHNGETDFVGLYVEGSVKGSATLDLFNTDYYIGNDDEVTLQNPGSEVGPFAGGVSDVFAAFGSKSSDLASYDDSSDVTPLAGSNFLKFDVGSDAFNVINFDSTSEVDGYEVGKLLSSTNTTIDFTGSLDDDTRLVVNYTHSESTPLVFNAQTTGNANSHPSRIIWNFLTDEEIRIGSGTFYGNILATSSPLLSYSGGGELRGQLVTKNLVWSASQQLHPSEPWSPSVIPEPGTVLISAFGSLLAIGTVLKRRRMLSKA